MTQVWHYDGTSAVRHDAVLSDAGSAFVLTFDDGVSAPVAWAELVARGKRGTSAVYGISDRPGWQIGFDGDIPAAITAKLPQDARYGGWVDRFGLWRAGAVFAAVSALLLVLTLKAPDWIAPHIPMRWEASLGHAMVGDLQGKFCNGPGGQAALDTLVKRVAGDGEPASVHVVNWGAINAVTLPGGTILIFDGLLRQAASPDEVAGVIGHEIGHVHHRDAMQALVRDAGLSLILGGFSGNATNTLNVLLAASYSRDAESKADDYAMAAMRQTHVNPHDTAALFTRLAKMEGPGSAALAFVAGHPVASGRAALFDHSARAGDAFTPALNHDQWAALADICHNDPARQHDDKSGVFE